ncbi:DUF72 domain-containing protein [Dongia soli]|uniref:DUF72 domain-containing protein n=1 Tax=Dongia soli TaxID=600628 RepID=A0ABU5ECZ6_9PROT|nr:DUF72 domain-containing protein [Dongia soli]MDY0883308.1 DUF72 domain-containing protein [Dongia soli]
MSRSGKVRIGISGWRYKPWRGVFYPEDLKQKDELPFAADCFPTIEINGTFYSLQRPESFAQWAAETPADFVFAVKGPRYITHLLRLKNVEKPLANFFASGIFELGAKLGPILWQFPPNFKFDSDRLEAFFKLLPQDTEAAARLARRHDDKVKGRTSLKPPKKIPLRHAMEIRHDSFRSPDFIKLLRKYKVGLVVADTVEWPCLMDLTSDFIYCRLHGSEVLYASGYDSRALSQWCKRVTAWAKGEEPKDAKRVLDEPAPKRATRDVYVYFDNDMKVRAPRDAASLIKRVEKALA